MMDALTQPNVDIDSQKLLNIHSYAIIYVVKSLVQEQIWSLKALSVVR